MPKKSPDKNILNVILDKINEKGMESLTDVEKTYLRQTSAGRVHEGTEKDFLATRNLDDEILDKIKIGDHIPVERLKKASQGVKDQYVKHLMENVFDPEKRRETIFEEELELGSQKLADEFVIGKTKIGDRLPPNYYKMISQEAVNEIIHILADRGEIVENNIVMLGSQENINWYIQTAAHRGEYISPGLLGKATEEIKVEYLQKIRDKKGEDILRMYKDV